jgi:hypothetical protein
MNGRTFQRMQIALDPKAAQASIGEALAAYVRQRGMFPPSLVVNRLRLAAARAVIDRAVAAGVQAGKAVPEVPVEANGGTLLGEVWFEVNDEHISA